MQFVRDFGSEATQVGQGLRVLYISGAEASEVEGFAVRLAAFGAVTEHQDELYAGVHAIMDDPACYGLMIVDCDSLGGLAVGTKLFRMLGDLRWRLPVILSGRDVTEQVFPTDRSAPICLRSPMSSVALRVGVEHALRERLAWKAA